MASPTPKPGSKTQEMAAFSTFLRFLKWKMDGKWKMENAHRIGHRQEWRSSGILFSQCTPFVGSVLTKF
jgi:hypothetical protein